MGNFDVAFVDALIEQAKDKMTVIKKGDSAYENARRMANSRLQKFPYAIAICETADDFSFWLGGLVTQDIPISIRSGGHHHEAMSSNDGGIVLVAKENHELTIERDHNHIWVSAGYHLEDVIRALGEVDRILPTGGCGKVCVGGLCHGGGWGMTYRTVGATVDALRAVQMVLPNGDIVEIGEDGLLTGQTSLDIDLREVFWAIRGGGGGNFGAVTRFRFQVYPLDTHYTEFTLHFRKSRRQAAAEEWVKLCVHADERLNLFARMTVVGGPEEFSSANPPFLVGGRFYGRRMDCADALAPLVDAVMPDYIDFQERRFEHPDHYVNAMTPNAAMRLSQGTNDLPAQAFVMQPSAASKDGPQSTCGGQPEPHKVTSLMPSADPATVIRNVATYIDKHPDRLGANLYVSFHGMGGAAKASNIATAFPWRGKDYMLQAQAWWSMNKFDGDPDELVGWVDGFRKHMAGHGDGAFINFADGEQDVQLYYGGSWDRLQTIKHALDPDWRLKFKLGIPPT